MITLYSKIEESKEYLLQFIKDKPEKAIVLGTGLGDFESSLESKIRVPYCDIPHFSVSTVSSHKGELIFGYLSGLPVLLMSGRFHYYEGYSAEQLTYPVRVLKSLGVKHIIFTNAAGGINPHFNEGDLVIVSDHINMMPEHPLRGTNDERLGPRFPDMAEAYNKNINSIFLEIAKKLNIKMFKGIYLALQGPSLETPAEYKMARILGADLVGMSTVPEVIVARHCRLEVTVFSIVSNVCYPKSKITETLLEEVIEVVSRSAQKLHNVLNYYFESLKH